MSSATPPNNTPPAPGQPPQGQPQGQAPVQPPYAPGQQPQGDTSPFQDPQNGVVPFSTFYKVVQGNKDLAEQLIPGITSPQGINLLGASQEGKPTVEFKTVNMLAKFNELLAQAKAHRAGAAHGQAHAKAQANGVPEYIPFNDVYKHIAPHDFNRFYEGTDGPMGQIGLNQYMQSRSDGQPYIMNPEHPNTVKKIQELRAHKAALVAAARAPKKPLPPGTSTEDDNP